VYAVLGLAWISFSDRVVEGTFPPDMITTVQTWKGWAFVAFTAALVFVTSLRALAQQAAVTEARRADETKIRQAATVYAHTREGVMITGPDARIIATNPAFTTITGYEEAEVLGRNPSLLKSSMHDRGWYREMWRSIQDAGYWQGEVWNRRKNGELYPEWLTISAVKNAAGETTNYVGVFTDITRIKHSEAQLDHLAHTDALTGLPNRLLLKSRLEHAVDRGLRAGTRVAVLLADVDGFKQINDSLGLEAGDDVLRAVAARLRGCLPPGATLGRLGADEFLVVAEDLPGMEPAADLARDLIDACQAPFPVAGHGDVHVSASVGISLCPDDAAAAGQLMQQAGSAMSHAKEAGGRTFRFHAPAMADAAQARFRLEADLRQALERGEFVLYYQPRAVLATGEIEGVEALVRWRRADNSVISPDDFIAHAETMGLVLPIGHWALGEACAQMQRWQGEGLPIRTMAVNVSPRQLRDPGFVPRVAEVLRTTGVAPASLEIEVTESAVLDDSAETDERIRALTALGVRLAIDDFGTGYASLGSLRRLQAGTVKIDRSFVSGLHSDTLSGALVGMIVSMAGHLKLRTVAEGVETEDQRAMLVDCGCELAQGYLFGRPVPPDELAERVRRAMTSQTSASNLQAPPR
jgi:diguanylate cyclase (GGDEF)-like protein/PAS domain S-box-containing protein